MIYYECSAVVHYSNYTGFPIITLNEETEGCLTSISFFILWLFVVS